MTHDPGTSVSKGNSFLFLELLLKSYFLIFAKKLNCEGKTLNIIPDINLTSVVLNNPNRHTINIKPKAEVVSEKLCEMHRESNC